MPAESVTLVHCFRVHAINSWISMRGKTDSLSMFISQSIEIFSLVHRGTGNKDLAGHLCYLCSNHMLQGKGGSRLQSSFWRRIRSGKISGEELEW
jgi:hypothetical protein